MKHTVVALFLAAALGWGAAVCVSRGDDVPPLPASVQEAPAADLLGSLFESEAAGLALRVPAGCHRIRSEGAGDDIGQFGDEHRNWQLKLHRILRPQPTALVDGVDNFNKPIGGLMNQTLNQLRRDLPACTVLRQDLTNIRDGDPKVKDNVAMIAVRYTAAGSHYLSQQAIIQASDRLFYLIALTTPGSHDAAADAPVDAGERVAVETFGQMLDSVRLLDTAKIRREQDERLIRTRALFVRWNKPRLHAALIGEQWLRVIRDGRDVGYSYITEETAAGVPRPLKREELRAGKGDRDLVQPGDGILIGVRSRSVNQAVETEGNKKPRGPIQLDSAAWLFVKPDRSFEDWSRVTVVTDSTVDKDGHPIQTQMEEFGTSGQRLVRTLEKGELPGSKVDPQEPPVRIREQYMLDVTSVGSTGAAEPLEQEVAKWYLPQALGNLLPRLLPLESAPDSQPRTYMFATYVPEIRQVMERYVEVGRETDVKLAGKTVRAIPISDRIGWHGAVTTHYMSADGKYLGSENKQTHTLILPTDAATLASIWKGADLTRPRGVERPHGAASANP